MAGLMADELKLLQQRLAEAESDARAEELASSTSFQRFLERVGILWLVQRIPDIVANVKDWLATIFEPLLNSF
jgi:hypothetical protein